MTETHQGSCLCETIKYEATGPFESFYFCHCKHCQKDTGSAHAANLFSTKADLHWISGKESIQTYHLPQTRHVKSFCKNCGSSVPNLQMDGKLLVVPAGSLNSEVTLKPTAHLFYLSKANWENNLESIKKFDGYPHS